MIRNTRSRICHALKGKSKSISTKEVLVIDIDTYKKWIEYQMTPEMSWINIELDRVQLVCIFNVSNEEKLTDGFRWKNTQTLLKEDHQRQRKKFSFLDYQLHFVKDYQFLILSAQEGYY